MNNKQRKTLEAVFKVPTPSNIKYNELISMLKSLDVKIKESSSGSRILLTFRGHTQVIHKPHPQSEIKQYAIRIIKEFLISTGVKL